MASNTITREGPKDVLVPEATPVSGTHPSTNTEPVPETNNNNMNNNNNGLSNALERKRMEIVQELLPLLQPFVNKSGLIKEDASLNDFAALISKEASNFVKQSVLLKMIKSTIDAVPIFKEKLIDCDEMMLAFSKIFTQDYASEEDSSNTLKIIEILQSFDFTVAQLVKYKYGKVIKKIVENPPTVPHPVRTRIHVGAKKLYESWNEIAKRSDDEKKAEKRQARKRSVDEAQEAPVVTPVSNFELFSEQPSTQFVSRGLKILERAARGESKTVVNRPLSADDIHKEKKRRMLLAGKLSNSTGSEEVTKSDEAIPKTRKKRVSFPDNEADLVRVVYFERDPSEYENTGTQGVNLDYHHADKAEASFAFDRFKRLEMSESGWQEPATLEQGSLIRGPEGSESEEVRVQERRERSVLSAIYYSQEQIPSSPAEDAVDTGYSNTRAKMIPLRDDCNTAPVIKTVPLHLLKTAQSSSGRYSPVQAAATIPQMPAYPDPNALSSLLANKAFQDLLSNPSLLTQSFSQMSSFPNPTMPMIPSYSSQTIQQQSAYDPTSNYSRPGNNQRRPSGEKPVNPAKRKKVPCKYYRAGVPDSCWRGEECNFLHAD